MQDCDDTFDNEQEECQDDDYYVDNIYESQVNDYYQHLEDENKFVLIYNTSTIREYIIPGTNINKIEQLNNNKVISIIYFKSNNYRKEEN